MDKDIFTAIKRRDEAKTFVSVKPFTRPLILEVILTPVINDCIDSKHIVLNIWTKKEGISEIAPGNEDFPKNVKRSFLH